MRRAPSWHLDGCFLQGAPAECVSDRHSVAVSASRSALGWGNPKSAVARVVLDHPSLREYYCYLVPENYREAVSVGSIVWVPSRNRRARGWVVGFDSAYEDHPHDGQLKAIEKVDPAFPVLTTEQVALAGSLARYYLCETRRFLRRMTPPSLRGLGKPRKEATAAQVEGAWVIEVVRESLSEAGFALEHRKGGGTSIDAEIALLCHEAGEFPAAALAEAIQRLSERGVGSIVALGSSYAREAARLRERLWGRHLYVDSGTPATRQKEVWTHAQTSGAVVFGDRAVVFQRCRRPSLFLVVDEGSPTHREQGVPHHATSTVVALRAAVEGSPALLSGSWFRYESLAAASSAFCSEGSLKNAGPGWDGRRASHRLFVVIDRSKEPPHPGALSERVATEIGRVTAEGGRVLVFVTRKGGYRATRCRDCGFVMSHDTAVRCRRCGSARLGGAAPGVQAVAEELGRVVPGRRLCVVTKETQSMDPDAQIVVGTEAVLYEPVVADLVVVQSFEALVSLVSYEAWWRAVRVIQQLAGVTGGAQRGQGRLLVQCFDSGHPILQALEHGDLWKAAVTDLEDRASAGLPPFTACVLVEASGHGAEELVEEAASWGEAAGSRARDALAVLGPHAEGSKFRVLLFHDGSLDLYDRALRLRRQAAGQGARLRIEVDPDFSYRRV